MEEGPEPAAGGESVEPAGADAPAAPHSIPPPLVLSAKSPEALAEQGARLAARLRENPEQSALDTAFSLATARFSFGTRAAVVGEEASQVGAALEALASGAAHERLVAAGAETSARPVFLFPGQGAQFAGMACELLGASPLFAHHMERCEEALDPHVEWSLAEVLAEEEGAWLERLDVVQPALFATMVSLARLWEACGVRPAAVVGHSQGEIAAAHVAGGLSLADAALIVAERGKAMTKLAGRGGMLSVSLPAEEIEPRLGPYGERLALAAINGPASLVLSGEPEALAEIEAELEREGARTRRVAVDYAAHSAQIEDLEEELLAAFEPISPRSGEVPLHSTLTGERIDTAQMDASYWYRNLRETVRLEPVVRSLLERGENNLIEIAPHPVLAFGVEETIEDALEDPSRAAVLATLRREEGGPERFALSLAEAHAHGVAVEWRRFFAGSGAKRVPLPTYPFQRRRYWLAAGAGPGDLGAAGLGEADHPLLGAVLEDPESERLTMTGAISLQSHPWLADHAVAGTVLFPGTGFLELALRAAEEAGCETVEELVLRSPLVLPESGAVQVRVSVAAPGERGERAIRIHSRPVPGAEDEKPGWALNAEGALGAQPGEAPAPLRSWPPAGARPLDVEFLYDRLAEAGIEYGDAFQGLRAAWADGEGLCVEASLPEEQTQRAERFGIHPALLDSVLHGLAVSLPEATRPQLPFAWSGVSVSTSGSAALRARIVRSERGASVRLYDRDGAAVARVDSLALRELDPTQLRLPTARDSGLLEIAWQEIAFADPVEAAETFAIASPPGDAGAAAARELTAAVLERVQVHLAQEGGRRLAIVTEGAVAVAEGESPHPAVAAAQGLVRSAQSEHPGRLLLVDTDGTEASARALAEALRQDAEPQLALREGTALVPRAVSVASTGALVPPPGGLWRLDAAAAGSLGGLALVPHPDAAEPLGPREVRVEIRAAGLNFRDLVVALGYEVPGGGALGSEGAGVVSEVGSEVSDLSPGDRVAGMIWNAFAPLAVADRALLVRVPEGWSFELAAAVPTVFMTALYGLVDLAGLKEGERVLVHAGAGGVGGAAIQIANRIGAEVYATAGPAKRSVLEAAGIPPERIASSRDLGFKEEFLEQTGREGMDVVLNSLAGEFVDASLDLLPRGGRFLEWARRTSATPSGSQRSGPGSPTAPSIWSKPGPSASRRCFPRRSPGSSGAPSLIRGSRPGTCAKPPLPSATSARGATSASSCSRCRGRSTPRRPSS